MTKESTCDLSGYLLEALESRSMLSAGALDQTFGAHGKLVSSAPTISSGGCDIAVQKDGRLLLAQDVARTVTGTSGGSDVRIVRYLANGQNDPSYGSGGKTTLNYAVSDYVQSIVVQADGKALVLMNGYRLTRLLVTGAIDTTFGSRGSVSLQNGPYAISLASDGRILVFSGKYATATVLVLKANGATDNSFGTVGTLALPEPLSPLDNQPVASSGVFAFQTATNKLLGITAFAATTMDGNGTVTATAEQVQVWRYLRDGKPDTSFGTNGTKLINLQPIIAGLAQDQNASVGAESAVLTRDGKLVVQLSVYLNGNYRMGLLCLNPDGTVNSSYGVSGYAPLPYNWLKKITATSDGGVGVLTFAASANYTHDIVLGRLTTQGKWLTSFGTNGRVRLDLGGNDNPEELIQQTDGKLLLLGVRQDAKHVETPVMARYLVK